MRFCTSELKVDVITSALKKRFPNHDIINVAGIRREESAGRRRMPIAAPLAKLRRKNHAGLSWNAIIEWPIQDVFYAIYEAGLNLHEAYTVYGASRVSCAYCIMSSEKDLIAAATCADNHELYKQMVELEAMSTFAFQGNRWLADVAPHLLTAELRQCVEISKAKANERQAIEANIPKHLLFTSGWPRVMPTVSEARLLAGVRKRISELLGFEADYLSADSILRRYETLIASKPTNTPV